MKTLLFLLFLFLFLFSAADSLKVGEGCGGGGKCDAGLECVACEAGKPRCARVEPTDPKTKGKGLAFNRYSWLTTHNSFALLNQRSFTGGSQRIAPSNQEDTVTAQLKNGVRGLMLDVYDFENDIWLCHSFGGTCYNFTAFQPAINVLKEIQAFLEANPEEIITIFLEDYVTSSKGVSKVFDDAGLRKYWFPVTSMPKNGEDWPLISDMISKNQRLIVFTSKKAKEASEGIAYEWNYVVENQYGNGGMKKGSCPSRAESAAMNDSKRSLVLINYFTDNPDQQSACKDNGAPLVDMLKTCHSLSSKRWANFIAVDFYKRSDGGGAPLATDTANGHLVCGCDNINYCKTNATLGTCEAPPPTLPATSPSATGPDQRLINAGPTLARRLFRCASVAVVAVVVLLA